MMREDVSGELSLSEFAQSVNLSVWRLCHVFKTDVGMPPMRYLRLLESSFLSVKEIGFRVGLTDESHFVRDFKATYGLSPACYRTQFNGNGGESANGDSHNGNGNGHSHDGNQQSQLGQQLIRVAKQSILPTLHLFVCVMSTM